MRVFKTGTIIVLGIVTMLYFVTLAIGDENGQEYEFYNAAKESAVVYADLGIITPEPIANIEKSEKQVGNKTEYLFHIPESIYDIKIRNNTVNNEEIRIETLKNVSDLTTSIPPGNVYINENIWIEPDTELYVDFKIKNSWLDKMTNVQLFKWTGDKWKKLGLRTIGNDDKYTYFEEGVAGSSVLSIIGDKKSLVDNGQNSQNGQKSFLSSLSISTIVTIILGLILVVYVIMEEAKKKEIKISKEVEKR